LFHDLGKMVTAASRPEVFEEILRGPQGPEVLVRECEVFGFAHQDAGAYLLGLWGIPSGIVEAVAHHHAPALVEPDRLGSAGAVHVAACLAEEALGGGGVPSETTLDLEWLTRLGLEQQLPTWRKWALEEKGKEVG
jgi:HD-like signal output (HDOD) protein